MTRIDLGEPAPVPPILRYALSIGAFEELARRSGVAPPWNAHADRTPVAHRLDAREDQTGADAGRGDARAELARAGLLTDGVMHADLATALAGFADPDAHVDLELALRRPTGTARLHSWHRRHATGITAVTVAGDAVELAWWSAAHWPGELARSVTPPSAAGGGGTPRAHLQMPYELLLAAGPAVRQGRSSVLAELLERHRGRVLDRDGTALTPASAAEQVVRLHTVERGRLQVRVTNARRRRERRLGLLTWMLFDDGWRELAPVPSAGEQVVVVRSVAPGRLGGSVARLVEAVAA